MEEEPEPNATASVPPPPPPPPGAFDGSSSSSSSSSQVHEEPEENINQFINPVEERQNQQSHQHHNQRVSYRLNFSISEVTSTQIGDDAWSCLIVIITFWFFASMTLILGFYGSMNLPLGPHCSRLIQANSLFVQTIKAQEIDESRQTPILYGFYETPPLDIVITWSEPHKAFVQSNYHKEWEYFLNKGSQVVISYSVKSPSSAPLSLVIAQGRESLVEWIEDPSFPNSTLSWNIIHGNGIIHQEISRPKIYYIAVGNLNSEEVEVQLNFTIKSILYNTTQAYYKCSLNHRSCNLKLFLLGANVAVLTSPGIDQGAPYSDWYVKLSYGPRWVIYFAGSGTMTAMILLAFRICNMFQIVRGDETGIQEGEMASERAPLLSHKDDDLLSWGSSYDSISHEDEELDEWLVVPPPPPSLDGKPPEEEGESNINLRRLCVLCSNAPRNCFFLPCSHCAACFTCGTRILEEAGTCPICKRTLKKVRKIFTV